MKTAMQELLKWAKNSDMSDTMISPQDLLNVINPLLEKEKEQIQKAFSDGQETPINHPTLPHYSREEYYDDNYKTETI
jgi:hypothetical protein